MINVKIMLDGTEMYPFQTMGVVNKGLKKIKSA